MSIDLKVYLLDFLLPVDLLGRRLFDLVVCNQGRENSLKKNIVDQSMSKVSVGLQRKKKQILRTWKKNWV